MDAKSKIPVPLYIRKATLFYGFLLVFTPFFIWLHWPLVYILQYTSFPSVFLISDWCSALVFILFY